MPPPFTRVKSPTLTSGANSTVCGYPRTSAGQTTYFTSGDALRMQRQIQQLLGIQTPARALRWHAEALEVE